MEFKWPGMMQQLARVVGPRTALEGSKIPGHQSSRAHGNNLSLCTKALFLWPATPPKCQKQIPATSLVTQIDSAGQATQRHGLVARSAESGPIKIYVAAAAGVSHKPISWPAGIAMPTAGF